MITRIPRNAKKVFYATESITRTKPDGTVIRRRHRLDGARWQPDQRLRHPGR
ncbi:hypothetical protein [Kitasatospora sp. NPDC087315]|uniref:hypothetical protein n=1 Tax=Kitasatospora sp. NPDC087315 TaxID=3364069 RepID=UPI003817D378